MGKPKPTGMRGLVCVSCLLSSLLAFSIAQDTGFKRAPFNSWAGKRSDPSLYDYGAARDALYGDLGEYLSEALRLREQGLDKRGVRPRAFSSWAGKRAPFSSWAGKRSGASVEKPQWYQEDYARKKRSLSANLDTA